MIATPFPAREPLRIAIAPSAIAARLVLALAIAAASAALSGCAAERQLTPAWAPEGARPGSAPQARPATTVGLASFYGRAFQGRVTASGERYDADKLTAAHRSLPFGTRVRVTNLANGRKVVVRVNDRGPFRAERIIDLSLHAAQKLQFGRQGITRVRLEIL